jgi:hypothetical protein
MKRPVILFETLSVSGFVKEEELKCEDELVLEPYFRLAWKVSKSDHGVVAH